MTTDTIWLNSANEAAVHVLVLVQNYRSGTSVLVRRDSWPNANVSPRGLAALSIARDLETAKPATSAPL
eukprot:scaffold276582_cov18-Prasinocladus_malaysianus.AAC.1